MKRLVGFAVVLILGMDGFAQVAQRGLAEHFTNTLCSVCARRNPDLIKSFDKNKDVIHYSIHPSRPYSGCKLNQHNVSENDTRTKYYGIYGATPKLLLNGKETQLAFRDASLFSSIQNKTTAIEVGATIKGLGNDSVQVNVVLETKASHSFGTEKLVVVLVEDTLFYNAPNGESTHYNVFRKSLTKIEGDAIALKAGIGEKLELDFSAKVHSDWNVKRIRAIAFVQKSSDKEVIQAYESDVLGNNAGTVSVQPKKEVTNVQLFPNPNKGSFVWVTPTEGNLSIYNSGGQLVVNRKAMVGENRYSDNLLPGIYHIVFQTNNELVTKKMLVTGL